MQDHIASLGAFALVFPVIVMAQTEPVELAPVVVTASRGPETADETLASVTVIDREDIERTQPQSVLDLLRTQAGIDVSSNGGLGTVSSVFLRGAESDQVLVLVDGVRAASSTSGTFSFRQLNPDQIERIEIVRGPRSTLYGSDAIGGVIQIFTRKANGPTAAIEGGSYDTYQVDAGYGGGDKVRYSINGAYVNSGGFSATNPSIPFDYDPDNDGYKEGSVTANLDAVLSKTASLRANGWHSDGKVEFDIGELDTENDTVGLNLYLDTFPVWRQTFGAGYSRDKSQTDSPTFPSEATSNRITFNWQNDIELAPTHQLTAGADYYRDDGKFVDLTGVSGSFDDTVDDIGGYLNLRSTFGKNEIQLGARYEEHSEFGGHATYQIALGRQFTDSLRGFAAHGTAFKAPTLNELFFPGFGNPDLDPESSRNTEIGVKFEPVDARFGFNASAFYTEINNLIDTGPGPLFRARNVDEATIKGVELGYDWDITTRWRFAADLTLQDAHNDTQDTELVRRPDHKAALSITRTFVNGGSFYTEVLLSGERTDVGDTRLPGYGIVNLSLQYPLLKSLFAEARVENLLDKDYELAAGYNTPGRSAYLGLRYAPGSSE